MMYLSATETAINANFKSEESAYFAARAGVEEVRDRVLPANANTINASLPTALPSGAGGVLYVEWRVREQYYEQHLALLR